MLLEKLSEMGSHVPMMVKFVMKEDSGSGSENIAKTVTLVGMIFLHMIFNTFNPMEK